MRQFFYYLGVVSFILYLDLMINLIVMLWGEDWSWKKVKEQCKDESFFIVVLAMVLGWFFLLIGSVLKIKETLDDKRILRKMEKDVT